MAVFPNGSLVNALPYTFSGGAVAESRIGPPNNGAKRAVFTVFPSRVSAPPGYGMQCPLPPTKAGGIATTAVDSVESVGGLTATAVLAKFMEATLTSNNSMSGNAGLIVAAACTMLAPHAFTATMQGAILLAANLASQGQIAASLSAIASCVCEMISQGQASGNMTGTAHAEANMTTAGAVLTAQTVAAAVWNSLASAFNDPGTMGELLNGAGAAGDPWIANIEGVHNAREVLRVLLAVAAGDAQVPPGTGPFVFKSQDGTTERVAGDVAADGTRTISTVDGG
jgi:hypothetical protein